MYRCLLETPTFPEGVDRHIYADFVPKLETVDDGFRWCVDPETSVTDPIFPCTEFKGRARHSHESGLRREYTGRPGFYVDRDPNLVWCLCCEPVELKRGQQTDDTIWNSVGDLYE
jgi:hypothetical protein